MTDGSLYRTEVLSSTLPVQAAVATRDCMTRTSSLLYSASALTKKVKKLVREGAVTAVLLPPGPSALISPLFLPVTIGLLLGLGHVVTYRSGLDRQPLLLISRAPILPHF